MKKEMEITSQLNLFKDQQSEQSTFSSEEMVRLQEIELERNILLTSVEQLKSSERNHIDQNAEFSVNIERLNEKLRTSENDMMEKTAECQMSGQNYTTVLSQLEHANKTNTEQLAKITRLETEYEKEKVRIEETKEV